MPGWEDIVNAGIGGLFNIMGGVSENNYRDWLKGALINVLNNARQREEQGWQSFYSGSGPLRDNSLGAINRAEQMLFGNDGAPGSMTSLKDDLMSVYGNLNPAQFQQSSITPEMAALIGAQSGGAQGLSPAIQAALARMTGGGRTGDSRTALDRAYEVISGSGYQGLLNTGADLLDNRGRTAQSRELTQLGLDAVKSGGGSPAFDALNGIAFNDIAGGGQTATTQQLIARALGLTTNPRTGGMNSLSSAGNMALASNGLTPTGAAGESVALKGLQTAGANDITNFLASRGKELASREGVLPIQQAVAMARDAAGQSARKASERAIAQALARGGGAGAVVASGSANQGLADFADETSAAEAQAVRDTLMGQQGLQLQQQGQGANMLTSGGGLQADFLSKYGNLLSGLEDVASRRWATGGNFMSDAERLALEREGLGYSAAQSGQNAETQRYLAALGLIPDIEQIKTQRAGTMGNLSLGAMAQELSRLNTGIGATNSYMQNRDTGMNQLFKALGLELDTTNSSGNILNSLVGTQGNLNNSAFGNYLNGQQMGTQQMAQFYNALANVLGQRGNLVGQQLDLSKIGMGGLTNLMDTSGRLTGTYGGGQFGLFSQQQGPNPWATIAQSGQTWIP